MITVRRASCKHLKHINPSECRIKTSRILKLKVPFASNQLYQQPALCFTSGIRTRRHLLSLPETQESNTETPEFQQDVVDSRVGVAGQQHAETTCVKDANLRAKAGRR